MKERAKARLPWLGGYLLLYLLWFFLLERRPAEACTLIRCPLDDLIPFCEWFILPYLLWFFYMAGAILFLTLTLPDRDFGQAAALLFGGMALCLVICTFFYSGLDLRPPLEEGKNFCTQLVALLWRTDTSTNVCPSIHCYGTLCVHALLGRAGSGSRHPALYGASGLLALAILLSTLFLKQHSVVDVVCAFLLAEGLHRQIYAQRPRYLALRPRKAGAGG